MTDLSREELRAHLSAVEAQVRAALRIVAAESKSVQQAHSALRADLSAALIRLQSEMNDGNKRIDGKVERVITEIDGLSRQRRLTATILFTLVLLFGVTLGLFAGGGWYILSQSDSAGISAPRSSGVSSGQASGASGGQSAAPSASISLPSAEGGEDGGADADARPGVTIAN